MSAKPWPAHGRVTAPVDLPPRVRCWECVAKDEQIARMESKIRELRRELVDVAAQMAVDEGPER